jgi:hypothetical protein
MIRAHLTLVHVIHVFASSDTPWVTLALSHCTSIRYGRIAFVSAAHEGTQFVGPHKIPYSPVHNSNLLTGARRPVFNRHRRGLPPWSSEFQIRPLPFFPIQYSPFSPNSPTRSPICQPFDPLTKTHRTSIDRKGHITTGFQPLNFYRYLIQLSIANYRYLSFIWVNKVV